MNGINAQRSAAASTAQEPEVMLPMLWFTDHANLVRLTAYMAENGSSAQDIACAVEKPWKFADEFIASQGA